MPEKLRLTEQEIAFYKPLIQLYLTYGSVDQVFAKLQHNTGVSYPHFHRILKDWGIIKSTGPKSHFTEAVYFLTELAKEKLPLETLYRSMPPSLQISAVTLHRILSYVKRGLVRRYATALIVSPEGEPKYALIGKEVITARPEVGKPIGSLSLPMTYSKPDEPAPESILRVIQQEVAAKMAVDRQPLHQLIPEKPKVAMTIDIADVRVRVYAITLPDQLLAEVSSYKLKDLTFAPLEQVGESVGLRSIYRAGVPEIAQGILQIGEAQPETPPHFGSLLNQELATLPAFA